MRVIQGDTLSNPCQYLSGGQPVDLSDSTITATVHSIDSRFSVSVTCCLSDQSATPGGFILGPADTSGWPVGAHVLLITREHNGVRASAKTVLTVEAK